VAADLHPNRKGPAVEMAQPRTLIAVPTYNERENIEPLVRVLLDTVAHADICLVDDGSPDGTADHAAALFGADPRFSLLRREGPRGYGRSLAEAYRMALQKGYMRLVQLDADFSHDPLVIPKLLAVSHAADVVIGSRYCAGGQILNWSLHRRLLSRAANAYVRWITGISVRDSTSGFRCYTREALQYLLDVGLDADGYAFLIEATSAAYRSGLRIVEVPICFIERRAGASKLSGGVMVEAALMPWRFGRINWQNCPPWRRERRASATRAPLRKPPRISVSHRSEHPIRD
jgi:dolichol-phosphate mannosyltransferase